METTYKNDTLKKYIWENWQTVDELSIKFDRSKRMIQKVITDLSLKGAIMKGSITFNYAIEGLVSKPIYQIKKWYLDEQ